MLPEELHDLVIKIQEFNAEFQNVEVKSAHQGAPKRLYDTISGFANQDSGGIIVFGLNEEEQFKAVGVYNSQDLQKKVAEQCKQMNPIVRPVFTMIKFDSGVVISAEIPSVDISERPCYYAGVGRTKGSYIRTGDFDEHMTEYEIYSYDAFRKKYQDDIRCIERARISDLDKTLLDEYLIKLKKSKPNLSKIEDKRLYELLGITRDGVPTVSALLVFSIYPQMFFPQLSITAISVAGYEIGDLGQSGERFIDNKRVDGPIPQMLEDAMAFVRKNMSIKTIIDETTGHRIDKPEYPVSAIREIILNALVHRDYSIHTEGMPIQIILFKDRIEVHNPGGLYGRLTLDKLGKVQPDTRNPVLANTIETLGLTENRYSGIPTVMSQMQLANLLPPLFTNDRNTFCVTLYNQIQNLPDGVAENSSDYITLVDFCKTPRSRNEITEFLELTTNYYAIQNYILPLVQKGILKMTIPDKPRSKNQKYVRA